MSFNKVPFEIDVETVQLLLSALLQSATTSKEVKAHGSGSPSSPPQSPVSSMMEAPPSYSQLQRSASSSVGGGSGSGSGSGSVSTAASSPPPSSAPKAQASSSVVVASSSASSTANGVSSSTAAGAPSKSLHVRKLAGDVTEAILTEVFQKCGPLTSVRVNVDRDTGRSLGTAYVNFKAYEDAQLALDTLNGSTLSGRQIVVDWARVTHTSMQPSTSAGPPPSSVARPYSVTSSSAAPSPSSCSSTTTSAPAVRQQPIPATTPVAGAQPSPRRSTPAHSSPHSSPIAAASATSSSRATVAGGHGRGGAGGGGGGGQYGHHKETTKTTKVVVRQEYKEEGPPPPPPLMATFVIDVSASMASSVEAVLSGMEVIYNEVLEDSDRLALFTFSDTPTMEFCPRAKGRVKWTETCQGIRTKVASGSLTALYSAVINCIKTTPPNNARFANQQREIIVLTDGGDNCSPEGSLETLRELMANPGLPHMHIIIMGVGVDTETEAVLSGLCAPDHCTYLPVTASAAAIEAAFQRAKQEQQARRSSFITTTTSISTTKSSSYLSSPSFPSPYPFRGGQGGDGSSSYGHYQSSSRSQGGRSGSGGGGFRQ